MKPNRNGTETIPQPEKPTNHQSEKHPALQFLARIRSVRQSSLALTRSLAASVAATGYRHRGEPIQPQQPAQMLRVPGISLHPVSRGPLQLRRRGHLTPDPGRT